MEAATPSTKERLSSLEKGFDGFDKDMEIGAKKRREIEVEKISSLKAEIDKLDILLNDKTSRRIELNKAIQEKFKNKLIIIANSVEQLLQDRQANTAKKIQHVNNCLDELQQKMRERKAQVLQNIFDKGEELESMLRHFKEECSVDKTLRVEREEYLAKQLTAHEQQVSAEFATHRKMRDERYNAIKQVLERNLSLRATAAARLHKFLNSEVRSLQEKTNAEIEMRKSEDDAIVSTLNEYTLKLQTSLKVLNSSDI